jgi:tetratricopeptide (TPR) repeat protein
MKDTHPSLETLARWLAGELEHEEVLREVVPHLVASCPVCQHLQEEIQRLQDESGHWNEVVAALETREAPALAAHLEGRPQEERMRLATENESLHTWGLCQYFLRASREAVFQDPAQAVDWARLAVRLSDHLSQSYHPDSIRDLRARAYSQLANAYRVLGELKGAEHAFLCARECLEASGTGDLSLRAEVLGLEASLCLDQRRFEDAGNLLDRSLALFRDLKAARGAAKVLLKKAKLLYMQDDLKQAISLLQQSEPEIEQAGDFRLSARSRQNLLGYLTLAGLHQEAEQLLPEVQALFRDIAEPLDRIKLRWAEASIAHGLWRPVEAEALYQEVRSAFLGLEKGYDAALVTLDLAALLAEQGRAAEVKPLTAEIVTVFGARGVDREALASLLLFQQACAEERVTLEMVRRLAVELRRSRPGLV